MKTHALRFHATPRPAPAQCKSRRQERRAMTSDTLSRTSLALLAAIGLSVAAYQADAVFAPLALALFIIALVWPLQSWLQDRAPALVALAVTMSLTITAMVAF